jgi:hypothetical protein
MGILDSSGPSVSMVATRRNVMVVAVPALKGRAKLAVPLRGKKRQSVAMRQKEMCLAFPALKGRAKLAVPLTR